VRSCSLVLMLAVIVGTINADSYQNPAEAAKAQDWNAVHSLLRGGASVNAALADGSSVLAWAVHWNNVPTTEYLLQTGADPDLANDFGITPLYLACENRNTPIIDLLLRAGANPNAATWTGETVLMTCSRTGSNDGVNALLTKGADINAREPERGQTALMWAAAGKHPAVVESLVEYGADIKARSRKVALPEQVFSPTYSKYAYFPKTKGDFTALMLAAQAGDLGSVQVLLTGGADVNESTPEYGSALVLAIFNGHEDVGLYLLEKGADPNITDGYGITPLHWAVQEGISGLYGMPSRTDRFWIIPNSSRLVKALLARGADPNARIQRDIPPYDVHRFARTRNNDIPQVRLAGATPFLLAAASGDVGIMNILLDANADHTITAYETERYISSSGPGLSPLMAAAGVGRERTRTAKADKYLDVVKQLVELGGDVNQVGPGGRTALHGAIYLQDTDMIRFLAEHGADLNAKDWYGQTAMSMVSGDPGGFSKRAGPGNTADNSLREEHPILEDVIGLLREYGAAPYDGPIADLSGR
jgi:uncharacterized protein